MVGGLVCKKGVWDGVFDLGGSADGRDDEDDRYDEYEEDSEGKERLALVSRSRSTPAALMRASTEAS
jgi:hypothetical protein